MPYKKHMTRATLCLLTGLMLISGIIPAKETAAALSTSDEDAFLIVTESGTDSYYFHSTFEPGRGTDGWKGRGAASVECSDQYSYAGSQALMVTERTAAWNGATKALGSDFVPGESYSFSAGVMCPENDVTFFMKLQYTDADGETQYSPVASGKAAKGKWLRLANTEYTIPEDAVNAELYIETEEGFDRFWVDEAIGAPGGIVIADAEIPAALIKGDINADGVIDVFDLALARRGVLNGFESQEAAYAADVDRNNTIDTEDIRLLQDYIHARITEFPAAEVIPGDEPEENPWDNYPETASPEMQQFYADSIYQIGNTARLREKIEKAQNGQDVTLAYIGGSITEGGRTDTCYVSRSYRYFAETFGTGSNVSHINAGLSGTSSVVGLMRAQNEILNASPDVIFIEFSVNDHPEMIYKKGYESLVKKCLSQPNAPAVILIINRAKGGYSMQEQMAAIGKNYDLPIISMDNALTKAFNSGLLTTDDYYTDEYHPHDKGNQLISDCIAYFYRQALKTENRSESYTIPSTTVYGTEYETGTIVSLDELTGFNAGSFQHTDKGYANLPYTLKHNANGGNTPITFTTEGKGIILVYSAKDDVSFGSVNVTVNGQTSTISGKKQYTWGGPEADVAYMQDTTGTMEVSINVEDAGTEFTIWGIGVVK